MDAVEAVAAGTRAAATSPSVVVDMDPAAPSDEATSLTEAEVVVKEAPVIEKSAPLGASRGKFAILAVGLAATVGVSATVAAMVASAVVSSARQEPSASFEDATARRLEPDVNASFCLDAEKGEMCHRLVEWIREDGARFDPGRYAGVNRSMPFVKAQALAHGHYPGLCPPPCGKRPIDEEAVSAESAHEAGLSCDYGHGDSKPAHAGCFVVHNGRLLAERLTYDREKLDVPGGQTNWNEPARCTAYRETYEETGYLVAPRELLAVVRNDFHLYRCELLRPEPLKGHDHEISWVGWLSAGEVASKAAQGLWRFPEANRYANWIR